MFDELFRLMGMMFLLIITGFILRKKDIITIQGKKCLTDIILYIILPCNIIKAYSMNLGNDFWQKFSLILFIGVLAQLLSIIVAKTLYNHMEESQKQVFQYATVCSNSGFMGNPLAQGVFGATGLLYTSIFLIPQRITMWTAGVSFFQKGSNKKEIYRKILLHPCMIATYIGMVIMIFQIRLPGVVSDTIMSFSNCITAMTMVYIGTILVEVDFTKLVDIKQIYFASIRLIILPGIIYIGCRIAQVDPLIIGVSTLLTATPAGGTTSLLAAKYSADEYSAAKCIVFTTLLSIITIPLWSMILLAGIQ